MNAELVLLKDGRIGVRWRPIDPDRFIFVELNKSSKSFDDCRKIQVDQSIKSLDGDDWYFNSKDKLFVIGVNKERK